MAIVKINTGSAKGLGFGVREYLTTVYAKIYKGTAPTDADTYVGNPLGYNGDLLVTIGTINLVWNSVSSTIEPTAGTYSGTATQGGVAAWCAVYNNTTPSYCVLSDVGLIGSSSPVTITAGSLTLTLNQTVTIADIGYKFTF
jgi:hypothetical protein